MLTKRNLNLLILAVAAVAFAHGEALMFALVLMEGFDHLTQAQLTAKGWSVNGSSMPAGRFGDQALRLAASGSQLSTAKTFPAAATVFVGLAVKSGGFAVSVNQDFLTLRAGATSAFRVGWSTSAGGVTTIIIRNSAGTIIATTTATFTAGVWYYVEVKAFINGASGTCELHLNGNPTAEIASTVGNFGSTNLDSLLITGANSGGYDFDDIYVCDSSGAAPRNTFLGDVRVKTVWPTSDGASSQWTPSTGSAHFSLVDETTPNDDTDFVSDATVGHIDLYGCGDIDTAATVYAVQHNLYARKDDAAVRQIAPVVRQGGANAVGTTFTLGSSYAFFSQIYGQDPTAAEWTPANVNADEFGVKEIA